MKRLASLFVAAVVVNACQEPTQPDAGSPPQFALREIVVGTETRITTDPAFSLHPAISGDRIVWVDLRNGNPDIYMFDLASGTETQITINTGWQNYPDISGDRIVWTDRRTWPMEIFMYDLGTNTETQIATGLPPGTPLSAISGDHIVWNTKHTNGDIFTFDLATRTEKQITSNATADLFPDISGDRIVWVDDRADPSLYHIFMYDLETNTETQLSIGKVYQVAPKISGNRILWTDFPQLNIIMFDLATNIGTPLFHGIAADISGDRFVWQGNSYEDGILNTDIYMFDLATGTETRITTDPAVQSKPAISGDRIVWEDRRNGTPDIWNPDIYMVEISTTVVPCIEALADQIDQFVTDGLISNRGVVEPLQALLDQAAAALDRGQDKATATLNAFIRLVSAQSGKGIDPDAAQTLIDLIQAVIDQTC